MWYSPKNTFHWPTSFIYVLFSTIHHPPIVSSSYESKKRNNLPSVLESYWSNCLVTHSLIKLAEITTMFVDSEKNTFVFHWSRKNSSILEEYTKLGFDMEVMLWDKCLWRISRESGYRKEKSIDCDEILTPMKWKKNRDLGKRAISSVS